MQRKRVHMETNDIPAGTGINLEAVVDETNGVNIHGLIANFGIEPLDGNANATGTWVLYCIPDEASNIASYSISVAEGEQVNAFVWACGIWACSNQQPFNKEVKLGTSRNCQRGARIVLQVRPENISAGQVKVIRSLCYFTKSL